MKINFKKLIKTTIIIAAAYSIGRMTGFMDTIAKYEDKITADAMDMGLFRANSVVGLGWRRAEG